MSINNNNNNAQKSTDIDKNEKLSKLINKSLEDIEYRTKSLKIKDIKIKENIRSIKLKEKKNSKITEEITTRKEELKLIKQLLTMKEEKSISIEDIISSYLDFIITTNKTLDDKLTSLMDKEININRKQRFINKLSEKELFDDNYDLSISGTVNKPTDISKFILKPKNLKEIKNGGDNLDDIFINRINNNNLFSIKRNDISLNSSFEKISNGIKTKERKKQNNNINKFINKDLTKFQNYSINTINISKIVNDTSSNIITERKLNNNNININKLDKETNHVYSITDRNDLPNYNISPNKKIRGARDTFKKLLNKLNKSDDLFFSSNNTDDLKNFILKVLNTQNFLRKILYICYDCAETYNVSQQKKVETIHDSDFIDNLIEGYEDVSEKNDLKEMNNIQTYEKGLEEIKKITLETKNLENTITQFAHKINIYE